jgi:hypothetical protein
MATSLLSSSTEDGRLPRSQATEIAGMRQSGIQLFQIGMAYESNGYGGPGSLSLPPQGEY